MKTRKAPGRYNPRNKRTTSSARAERWAERLRHLGLLVLVWDYPAGEGYAQAVEYCWPHL